MTAHALLSTLIFTGIAIWLSVAWFNNLTDRCTNEMLLGTMISMSLLHEDQSLGRGLLWRAWPERWKREILSAVLVMQACVIASLWIAAFGWGGAAIGLMPSIDARACGEAALCGFIGLWLFFLVGGLWFGYWMKQGHIQQVHFALLQVGLLAAIFNEYG